MIARLRELVSYRDLIWNLVVRDLKVRYKNSVLGFLWSLLNPLMLMVVFTVVFTIMLPNDSTSNFPVFVLCALLPWNFFSVAVSSSVPSIVQNATLVKKVYFPREILPIATVLSSLANFILALPVLFLLMALFGVRSSIWLAYLPLIMLVQVAFTVGVALILSTLNVFYRDTGVIIDVVMQAWFFLTPVFYPIDLIPESSVWLGIALPLRRLVYILNPMASIIASYRSILYGFTDGSPPAPPAFDFFSRTLVTALVVLVAGYWVFTRYSSRFGEEV
ncbi:MAG: ABC transporter permease [Anaerolineae bacterium]